MFSISSDFLKHCLMDQHRTLSCNKIEEMKILQSLDLQPNSNLSNKTIDKPGTNMCGVVAQHLRHYTIVASVGNNLFKN